MRRRRVRCARRRSRLRRIDSPPLRLLPWRIEERELAHHRARALATMLDRHLDLDFRARLGVLRAHMAEHEVFLEQRGPGSARRVADLLSATMNRRARSPGDVRNVR